MHCKSCKLQKDKQINTITGICYTCHDHRFSPEIYNYKNVDSKTPCKKCKLSFMPSTINHFYGYCGTCYNNRCNIARPVRLTQTAWKKLRECSWIKTFKSVDHTGECKICLRSIEYDHDCELAHILARAHFGEDVYNNVEFTCNKCNKKCGRWRLDIFIKKVYPNRMESIEYL